MTDIFTKYFSYLKIQYVFLFIQVFYVCLFLIFNENSLKILLLGMIISIGF